MNMNSLFHLQKSWAILTYFQQPCVEKVLRYNVPIPQTGQQNRNGLNPLEKWQDGTKDKKKGRNHRFLLPRPCTENMQPNHGNLIYLLMKLLNYANLNG